jgi:hypothetical protein
MTRRTWIVTFGAALCAGWLPACSYLLPWRAADRPTSVVQDTVVPQREGDDVRVVSQIEKKPPSGSTYAPLPPNPHRPEPPTNIPGGALLPQLTPTGPDVTPQPRLPTPGEAVVQPVRAPEGPAGPQPPDGPGRAPRPPADPPLVEAMRSFLKGRADQALTQLPNCDEPNRQLLILLLPIVAQIAETSLDRLGAEEMVHLQNQLQGVESALRPRAPFLIEKICYCKQIRGFGDYDRLPDDHRFKARTDDGRVGELVQIYVELRNFASEQGEHEYVTRLRSAVAIRRAAAPPDEEPICELAISKERQVRSYTPRRDCHHGVSFYVPHLPPGPYVLTLTIEDVTRAGQRRADQRSLDFRVISGAP